MRPKAAYSHGLSLSGPPANVAEAVYTEAHCSLSPRGEWREGLRVPAAARPGRTTRRKLGLFPDTVTATYWISQARAELTLLHPQPARLR
jgi:hypothetical protein